MQEPIDYLTPALPAGLRRVLMRVVDATPSALERYGRVVDRPIMIRLLAVLCASLIAATTALAEDRAQVVGTWKLLSFMNEFQDGSEQKPMYGNHPTGYTIFTPEGQMMTIVEAEGRKAPQTDEERAAAFRSLIAYMGMYRLEGDKFITKVDVSWTPAWVGTEQTRSFKVDGDRLQLMTLWVMSPNLGKMSRATSIWQRVK